MNSCFHIKITTKSLEVITVNVKITLVIPDWRSL